LTWVRPSLEQRQLALLWCVVALSLLALSPLLTAMAPLFPHCPFHVITGIPCPSCGATRGGLALLRGHVLSALAFNPLAVLAECSFLLGGLAAPLYLALGGKLPVLPKPLPGWLRGAAVAVIFVNWVWLIARGV
jgi:hypothetical protein